MWRKKPKKISPSWQRKKIRQDFYLKPTTYCSLIAKTGHTTRWCEVRADIEEQLSSTSPSWSLSTKCCWAFLLQMDVGISESFLKNTNWCVVFKWWRKVKPKCLGFKDQVFSMDKVKTRMIIIWSSQENRTQYSKGSFKFVKSKQRNHVRWSFSWCTPPPSSKQSKVETIEFWWLFVKRHNLSP